MADAGTSWTGQGEPRPDQQSAGSARHDIPAGHLESSEPDHPALSENWHSRPTPFYEDDLVTLFHGDCRELLPSLYADVVITDPPYNAGKAYGDGTDDDQSEPAYRAWLTECLWLCAESTRDGLVWFPGARNVFDVSAVLPARARALRMLGWHKREFAGDLFRGVGPPYAWEPIVWASVAEKPFANTVFGHAGRDFFIVDSNRKKAWGHPTPKNLTVMRWLVGLFCPPEGLVLDPFAGSGTTLRAAKDLGRRSIGIEIEERWCEETVRRLSQEVLVP